MREQVNNFDYIFNTTAPIARKYGVKKISLFGSRARGEEKATSDYDFVITRGEIKTLFQLAGFIDELENAFGTHVDVITDTSSDFEFLNRIKSEEVVVYERQG